MRILLYIGVCLFVLLPAHAQTIGGNTVYNFLNLSNTPQLTGLGGVNISNISNDVGMSFNNPALLRESMHTQADFVFNSFYAGIKNYHLLAALRSERLETNFSWGVNYFT